MNRIYRVVFNSQLGIWQAVCECARGRGKSGRSSVVGATAALLLLGASLPALLQPLDAQAQSYQYGASGAGGAGSSNSYAGGAGGTGGGGGGSSSTDNIGGDGGGVGAGRGAGNKGNGGSSAAATKIDTTSNTLSSYTQGSVYIGGSGGGGGGAYGTTTGAAGRNGDNVTLSVGNANVTVSGNLRVGGAGGGAGAGTTGNANTKGGNGGNGGAGILNLSADNGSTSANLTVGGSLQIGGEAGKLGSYLDGTSTSTFNGNSGTPGAGGTGTVNFLGSGSLTVTNGIVLGSNGSIEAKQGQNKTFTVTGNISGSGSFTQSGKGTTVLLGAATHTGVTTISAGTLQLGNNTTKAGSITAGSIAGNITNNGALVVNNASNETLGGDISGSGTLTQQGKGSTTLMGDNTYTGGTTITNGTLQVGNGGTKGTLGSGTVNNSSSLVFNRSDALTVANTINGTGSLKQAGSGTLVLTGANGYSGLTTINADTTLQVGSGGTSGTLGTGAVTNNGTLAVNRSNEVSISNVIGGKGSLIQMGSGTTTLTNTNNNYSGGTTINAGTLAISSNANLGDTEGGLNINNGAALQTTATLSTSRNIELGGTGGKLSPNSSTTLTATGVISGSTLTMDGPGTLMLVGTNTYTGGTTVSSGTLQVGAGGNTGTLGTGNISIASGSTLAFNRSGSDLTVAGDISGAGTVKQNGSGTTVLTGDNSYSGGTTISNGTLQVGDNSTGTKGTLGSGTVTNNSKLVFNRGEAITVGNAINGSGSVTQAGRGTLVLTGANGYSGLTTINTGTTLQVGSGGTSGSLGTGAVTNNGTLVINRSNAFSVSNVISGLGSLTQMGNGTTTLTASNNYTGGTTVTSGTLKSGATGAFVNSTAYTVNGGTLDLNGNDLTVSSLSGTRVGMSAGTVALNNATLAVNQATGTASSYAGVITGTGTESKLLKSGAGTFTLSGANSYQGGTTLNAGTLVVGNNGSLGGGALTVGGASTSTSTLDSSIAVTLGNKITLNKSLTLAGSQDMTLNGEVSGTGNVASLVKKGTANLTLSGANTYEGGTTLNAGSLTVGNNLALGSGALTVGGASTLDSSTAVTLANKVTLNDTLTLGGTNDMTLNGKVSGTASTARLVKEGGANLTLINANEYEGGTTLNKGSLTVGTNAALGKGALTVGGASTLASTTYVELDNHIELGANTLTVTGGSGMGLRGNVSGTGSLIKDDTADLTLAGVNTYGGGTLLKGGTLKVGNNVALGTGTLTVGGAAKLDSIVATGVVALANTIQLDDTLTLAGSKDLTLGGVISGSGGLVKEGDSNLTLNGANRYTGGTTLSAGTLKVGNDTAMGRGALSVIGTSTLDSIAAVSLANAIQLNSSGPLTLSGSNAMTLGGVISGNGSLVKNGDASLTLSGTNGYSGGTTLNKGSLTVGNAMALGTGRLTVGGASTLDSSVASGVGALGNSVLLNANLTLAGSNAMTLNGVVSGNSGLVKNGDANLTLNAANSYKGDTTLNAGTLTVGNNKALGTDGALIVGGVSTLDSSAAMGVVALNNNVTLNNTLTLGGTKDMTLSGVVSGTGNVASLVKNGAANLTLSGANTYEGGTTLNVGTLTVGNNAALGAGALIVGGASTLDSSAAVTLGNNVTLNNTLTLAGSQDMTLNGVVSGSSGLVKNGATHLTLNGENTFAGGVTLNRGTAINVGTLTVGDDKALGMGTLTLDGALTLNSSPDVVLANNVQLGSRSTDILTVAGANALTLGGAISGGGGLIKDGAGTLTLNGTSNYSGGTTVGKGTLAVNGSILGDVVVHNGATLGGTGTVGTAGTVGNAASTVTIVNGGTLSPGNSPGTLTVAGNLVLGSGSTTVFELGQAGVVGGASNDLVKVGGDLTLGGTLQASAASAGWYRLFNYGGDLTSNFSSVNVTGSGGVGTPAPGVGTVQLGTSGQVNLAVLGNGQSMQFWTGNTSNVWDTLASNWVNTTPDGDAATWVGSVGVFGSESGAQPGTVTVQGSQAFDTLQFSANGYEIAADTGTNPGSLIIAPLNGSAATINTGAGISATISAPIADGGGNQLIKAGSGTLTLSGGNTYTGDTQINDGTLVADYSGQTGSALGTGAVEVNGAGSTLQVKHDTKLGNAISLNGGTLDNAGTLTVTGLAVHGLAGTTATVNNHDGGAIVSLSTGTDGVGVQLDGRGSVTNQSGGTITGTNIGVDLGEFGTLTNKGQGSAIAGFLGAGVKGSGSGNVVSNLDGASIAGGGVGVALTNGGTVVNDGNASTILGGMAGVAISGPAGSLTNSNGARIEGLGVFPFGAGVQLSVGSTLDNNTGASINGVATGVLLDNGSLTNSTNASITGGVYGVSVGNGGGSITNEATATISGGLNSVTSSGATTLVNAGQLVGDVRLDATAEHAVTLTSGGTIQGQLNIGTNTESTLTLNGTGTAQKYSDTVNGAVSGATTFVGKLIKEGSGTWIANVALTPADVAVNGGTLVAATNNALGAGMVTVNNSADLASTLQVASGVGINNAINLVQGGALDNAGLISGTGASVGNRSVLVQGNNGAATVVNHDGGQIMAGVGAGGSALGAVMLTSGGSVTNTGQGLGGAASEISSASGTAVMITGYAGSVTNSGGARIESSVASGVLMTAGGTVTNDGPSQILAAAPGNAGVAIFGGPGWVTNTNGALIRGGDIGVFLDQGGNVINGANSTIEGGSQSVLSFGSTSLENAGLLVGNVSLGSTSGNLVTLVSGGQIQGDLDVGSNRGSRLTLDGAAPQLYSQAVTGATTFAGVLGVANNANWTLDRDLTAASTHIGAGGTLQLGDAGTNAGTTGSVGAGAISNEGTLVVNRSNEITLAGDISGGGQLKQSGTGVLVLTGNNSYTGTTTIDAGTLQVGAGGTSGNLGAGDVVNNGTLAINRSDAVTLANNIGGTGALVQQGTGTTTLTGSNGYTGTTTIDAGTLQVGAGATSGNLGAGDVTNNGTLAINRSDAVTLANNIGGTGALVQQGGGTTTLTGSNGYTGTTTIDAGTLQVGAGGTSGSLGSGDVTNNGTLVLNRSDAMTVANNIGGAGALVQQGTGTTTLTGSNGYTGTTTIDAGTLQVGAGATSGNLGTGDVINNGTLAINRSDAVTVANNIGGTGALVQQGTGTTTLTGSNSYAGTTTIDAGTLQVGAGGTSGNLGSGDVLNNGTLAINRSDNVLLANNINGTGALVQQGTGITALTGANNYAGTTTINAGTLQVGTGGQSGTLGGGAIVNNAQLSINRSDALTLAQNISGSGVLLQTGTGTTTLTGTNSYTGGTVVGSGTLQAGSADALPQNTAYYLNQGATLDLNSHALQTSFLLGSGNVQLGSASLTVNNNAGQSDSLSGQVAGTGGLIKQGDGTLRLSGASNYTGGTRVLAGRLDVGDNNALGTGTLDLADGTTLGFVANNLKIANDIVMSGVGDPTFDTAANTTTLTGNISGTGDLTKTGTGTLLLSGSNNYTGVTTVAQGTLQADAANTFSSASAHNVAAGAMLDLAGYNQTLSSLSNSGIVNLSSHGGGTPGTVLKVTGAYVGNGGTLGISTVLAADGSASDKLLLSGANAVASGSTTVQVTNAGGLGAQTTGNGIEVIATENGGKLESGSFTLAGGHVDAGAYEYRLFQTEQGAALKTSNTDPAEPVTYRNEAPLVSALPAQLRQSDAAMLGDLRKRMGDDNVTGTAASNTVSADAGFGRRAWGRILRTDPTITQQGTVSPQSSGHLTGFQAGLDLYSSQNIKGGFYVGQLQGDMSVTGFAGGINNKAVGFNSLTSRYLGLYGTWQNGSGLYADAVLQGADYRSTLHSSDSTGAGVSSVTKGSGVLASLELGQAFALGANWQIEPQAQISYRSISLKDSNMSLAQVKNNADNDWTLRLGARIKGSFATSVGQFQPYGRINVYKASNTNDVANFIVPAATTQISAKGGYTATELAAGASLQLNQSTSIYGELGKLWANSGDSRVKSGVQASVGVRVRW